MKILQIGFGNNPGGVEAFVMNYYRELSRAEIQFDFLCMYGKPAYAEEIRSRGGKLFYVPNIKRNYFGYVKSVKNILMRGNYDAVHVNMLSAANITPLRLAKKYSSAKVIAHSHNSSVPGLIRSLMDKMNRPNVGKYADVKLACGEKAGRWMFGNQAFDAGEVRIIRNAIDVEKYLFSAVKREQLRKALGLEDKFVIGHVGRFETQKNHDALIDIFIEVLKRIPEAQLCLIGDGVLKSHIEEKVQQAGIGENVFFAGVREDVANMLSAMDLFLFPSLFEGLPFTLVEAQTNGLPCVISDTITEEVVINKNTVKKVPLEAGPDIWANAVELFRNKQRRHTELVKKEMEAAHFDIKKEADRLRRLYQE